MENSDFITIPSAFNGLGLSATEKLALSLVYGFDKNNNGVFYGSISYIQEWLGCSKPTAISTMKRLESRKLISRGMSIINNEPRRVYRIDWEGLKNLTTVKNFNLGGKKTLPNNIDDNIERDINISNISIKEASFDFNKELVSLGVPASLASEWMKVRKAKKATNTETAFNAVKREINKAGITAEQAIRTAVENSWSGFKASWLSNERNASRVRPHKESVFEHNLKVADQMFGTNYHATIYGKREACDEQ